MAIAVPGASLAVLAAIATGAGGSTQPARTATDPYAVVHAWIPATHTTCNHTRGPLTYHYPLRPFLVQHPIRGNFGDPRTIQTNADVPIGTPGAASVSFHNGVDISADTGTAVYPVVSGVARIGYADEVIVGTGDGRVFQYFHLKPTIRPGQRVIAYRTVIGHVVPGALHVHLSEIDGFQVHNPADPGHLEPYADSTIPTVLGVTYANASGTFLDPRSIRGRVFIAARAQDEPPLPVPFPWLGFPVTPALVTWRLTNRAGRLVVPDTVAADFRHTVPANRLFWTVYAAGTYQNFPVYGDVYHFGEPGRYFFNLTPRGLDTTRLPNGNYHLTVHLADACGNRGLLGELITVHNVPRNALSTSRPLTPPTTTSPPLTQPTTTTQP
jgi:hypothetical protein